MSREPLSTANGGRRKRKHERMVAPAWAFCCLRALATARNVNRQWGISISQRVNGDSDAVMAVNNGARGARAACAGDALIAGHCDNKSNTNRNAIGTTLLCAILINAAGAIREAVARRGGPRLRTPFCGINPAPATLCSPLFFLLPLTFPLLSLLSPFLLLRGTFSFFCILLHARLSVGTGYRL